MEYICFLLLNITLLQTQWLINIYDLTIFLGQESGPVLTAFYAQGSMRLKSGGDQGAVISSTPSGCWQNLIPCGSRTEIRSFFAGFQSGVAFKCSGPPAVSYHLTVLPTT